MKKVTKSLIAVTLSLCLAFSCAMPVLAAPSQSNSAVTVAEELYDGASEAAAAPFFWSNQQ